MNLSQQRFLTVRKFELEDDFVLYSLSGIFGKQVFRIQYEDIELSNAYKKIKAYSGFLLISILFGLLFLVVLLAFFTDSGKFDSWDFLLGTLLLTLISGSLYYFSQTEQILIETSSIWGPIILLANNPLNIKESEKFLVDLRFKNNTYLKKKYAKVNKNETYYDLIKRLSWLSLTGVISNEESNALKEEFINNGGIIP